jgi:hypothetical protein
VHLTTADGEVDPLEDLLRPALGLDLDAKVADTEF